MGICKVTVVFRGRVQGVGFRFFVDRNAGREGAGGWVENLPDGSVQAVFVGEKITLERLLEACRQGPRAGKVEEMSVTWEDYQGTPGSFEIRY